MKDEVRVGDTKDSECSCNGRVVSIHALYSRGSRLESHLVSQRLCTRTLVCDSVAKLIYSCLGSEVPC